jgi:hypothetical protein
VRQQTIEEESMLGYHRFQNIVSIIKPLILQRTKKENYVPLHFCGQSYQAILKRSLLLRQLVMGKPKFKKILVKHGSGTSTDEDFYSSPSKLKKVTKKSQPASKEH